MDRDSFSVDRMVEGQFQPITFARGEYVRAGKAFGEITGISHAKREVCVGNVWYGFGYIYKAERPVITKKVRSPVTLSRAIENMNKRNGIELTDEHRVPAEFMAYRSA